jgi:hypothetical protein
VTFSWLDLSPVAAAGATVVLWAALDSIFVLSGSSRYTPRALVAWLIREAIFLPMWISALFARTVRWHGRRVPVVSGQKA